MNFNIESTAEYELIFQISTSISNILLIISCIIIWKLFEKKKINKMGITSIKKGYKELVIGLVLGAITMSIVAIIIIAIGNVTQSTADTLKRHGSLCQAVRNLW